MDWTRNHLYAISLGAAGLLLIFGALIVANHTSEPTQGGVTTWGGSPAVIDVPSAQKYPVSGPPTAAPLNPTASGTLPYQPQQPAAANPSASVAPGSASDYDFTALMATLSAHGSSSKPSSRPSAAAGQDTSAWDYIPTGIISVKIPTSGRSPLQESLYRYGNEVGTFIQGYDATHHDQIAIIDASDKDRTNASKSAAVAKIGADLETLGLNIAQIGDVPSLMKGPNDSLAQGYITIGKKLEAVAQAESGSDTDLVAAIRSYDAAVNSFNTYYVTIADDLSSANVSFSAADPGSVFSFNASAL